MKRFMLSLSVSSTLLFVCDAGAPDDATTTVSAPINNGQLDGDAHPYVGLALFGLDGKCAGTGFHHRVTSTV